jgi:glyoxylase-like metal-dependent hydrolase (beta-lactamase superfamily II)
MTEDPMTDLRHVIAPNPSAMTERGTNTWIVGRGEVAVIDPGPAIPVHLDAILAALTPGERVTHILVTHAHLDHSALAPSLSARTGAPVLAFGSARDGISPAMLALGLAGTGGEGLDAGFAPDERLGDGDVIEGPGWRLQAIHTPGHLGSHLCFAWGAACFTGDHVMGWSTSLVSPPEGDMGAYMASLGRLGQREWSRFLPGHGTTVRDPATRLAALTEHRHGREAQILAALAGGSCTPAALARAIYTDLPAPLLPAAERNVLAHLLDLAERSLVQADPAPAAFARFTRT